MAAPVPTSGASPSLLRLVQRCPILPRSRHLPVVVTEGSLTRNINKYRVRLWTDSSWPMPWTNRAAGLEQ